MSINEAEAIKFPPVFLIDCSKRVAHELKFDPLIELIYGTLPKVCELPLRDMGSWGLNDQDQTVHSLNYLLDDLDSWALGQGLTDRPEPDCDRTAWRNFAKVVIIGPKLTSSSKLRKRMKILFPRATFFRAEERGFIYRRHPIWALAEADSSNGKTVPERIEDLDLSTRTSNLLRRSGIWTVEDLRNLSEDDLRRIDGIGDASLQEIYNALEEYGVTLRMSR